MPGITDQVTALQTQVAALRAFVQGSRYQSTLYAMIGSSCVYGMRITWPNISGYPFLIALDGQAFGSPSDETHLNPEYDAELAYAWQYPNIACVYGDVFMSDDVNRLIVDNDALTIDDPPTTAGFGRFDLVYAYVNQGGGIGIATGTASANAYTLFHADGIPTSAAGPGIAQLANDPALPTGTLALARIYVEQGDVALSAARIADIRTFVPRFMTEALVAGALPITGGTLLGDLKFTDASYDIGKSGATRPRDLFLSRNLVVGGTFSLATALTTPSTTFTLVNSTATTVNAFGAATVLNIGNASGTVTALGDWNIGDVLTAATSISQGTLVSGSTLSTQGGLGVKGTVTTAASAGYIDWSSTGTRLYSVGASGSTKGTWTILSKGADGSSITAASCDNAGDWTFYDDITTTGLITGKAFTATNSSAGGVIITRNANYNGSDTIYDKYYLKNASNSLEEFFEIRTINSVRTAGAVCGKYECYVASDSSLIKILEMYNTGGGDSTGSAIGIYGELSVANGISTSSGSVSGAWLQSWATGTGEVSQIALKTFIAGTTYIGVDNSTGSEWGTAGNYGTVIYRPAATEFDISRAGTSDFHIGATGLVSTANTTDATSSTAGAFTMAGGLGIAKKLYVGTNAAVGGTLSVTGAMTASSTVTLGVQGSVNAIVNTADNMYLNIDSNNDGGTANSLIIAKGRTGAAGGTELLTVAGTGAVTFDGAGASRATGGIRIGADSTNNLLDDASTGAGTATLYIGNASVNVTSDERVKSNIRPLGDGLGIVRALTPVEFDQDENRPWGNVRHYVGFTAQDIHKVAPWAVNTQGDTGLPWQARYEFLMGPMVRAMQQLDERLKSVERMVH